MLRDRLVAFEWQGKHYTTSVPSSWPNDAVAEVCAFRAGANPGDAFELVLDQHGNWHLVAIGGEV